MNFFWKKDKTIEYSKELVEYIIRDILNNTINRNELLNLMKEELEPIIGKHILNQFFVKLNSIEKKDDKYKKEYWINKAKDADGEEIFDR